MGPVAGAQEQLLLGEAGSVAAWGANTSSNSKGMGSLVRHGREGGCPWFCSFACQRPSCTVATLQQFALCPPVCPAHLPQGTVRLLFQPAEEGGAGGDLLVKEGE